MGDVTLLPPAGAAGLCSLMGVEGGGGGGPKVNMEGGGDPKVYTWCLTSTETTRLIRDGENGRKGYGGRGRGREIIYLSLHCHHQSDFCIKMGSEVSHFNVSVGSDGQSTQTTAFLKRKESRSGIEPRSFRLPAYRLTARPNRLSTKEKRWRDVYIPS